MENQNEIKLVQYPVITHQLIKVGQSVQKRLDDLKIESQVATVDTVKSLKDLRAELNKELAEFEARRKFIKSEVLKPYDEFNATYEAEISGKYTNAITILKDKIAEVETKVKTDKKARIESYFKELCTAEKIDFLTFDKLDIEINLSTTEKAYKEKCNEFITKVIDDLNLIKTNENEAEILVEYKKTLNASKAITEVNDRKKKEKEEAARIKQQQITSRVNQLAALGLNFVDITNSYEFPNSEIFVTYNDVSELSNDKFIEKIAEIEEKIKEKIKATRPISGGNFTAPVEKATTPAPAINAPVKEETVIAKFQVSGTREQLKKLGEYMKTNGIIYKNI